LDPVTHFLTGACLGRSGFNRKTQLATVTMVLAAEAADLDVLWEIKGSIAGLQHHRGITHSFVGVPFVAAAVLGFVYLIHRVRKRKQPADADPPAPRSKPPLRWGYLYFCALLAALSHLLLDYTTAYGIRLFEPFNYRWYSWDIVYIVEPLMLLALVAGLALPAFLGLISQEVGARSQGPRGRVGAIAALVCVVLIWGVRDNQHRRALTAMDSFLYHGAQPKRVAAYPYMINPLRWHGVVETADFFETTPVNSLGPDVDSEAGVVFYKPPETDVALAAKKSYLGRVYLDWAVFPFVRQEKLEDPSGFLVEFQDLRYSYPSLTIAHRAPLGGFVLLSPDLRVLQQGMNSSKSPSVDSQEQPSGRQ
jgi:inner membrane protein